MIRVFVVDNHPIVIEGIRAILDRTSNIRLIGSASNFQGCKEWMMHNSADILLIKIQLEKLNGIEVCKLLTKIFPKLKIIALTCLLEKNWIMRMFSSGATGYILKSTNTSDLITTIRKVHVGEDYLAPEIYKLLFNPTRASKRFIPKLTNREKEVVGLIYDEYTNQEMAKKIVYFCFYGRDPSLECD